MNAPVKIETTLKDWETDQEVRWCPGCGDYAILKAVQRTLPQLGADPANTVFISGIGCSSRFPYYVESYGFHTIHGRAPSLATGVKLSNPDLDVWVVTGDGDAMSIGGNHFIHMMRRNVGLKVLMFNNRIYGLTKGQYSPTSPQGKVTKSTPMGSLDFPFSPIALALGAGGTFVARSVDILAPHLQATIKRADAHGGTSVVEVYQNCNIVNDGAYKHFTDKGVRSERMIELEHGKPLLFGENKDKGIAFDANFQPYIVEGDDLIKAFVWDETSESPAPAMALATMDEERFPVPIGVFRRQEKASYEQAVNLQVEHAKSTTQQSLKDLLYSGELWDVG